MKKTFLLVSSMLAPFLFCSCGRYCSYELVSDYNTAFVYALYRDEQCRKVREFRAKHGGEVCKAEQGDIQKSSITIDVNAVSDSVLSSCN